MSIDLYVSTNNVLNATAVYPIVGFDAFILQTVEKSVKIQSMSLATFQKRNDNCFVAGAVLLLFGLTGLFLLGLAYGPTNVPDGAVSHILYIGSLVCAWTAVAIVVPTGLIEFVISKVTE